ncbi:hypothetical protein V1291_000059 [Nitrobacteraceae bacterium AZCC 1564]
MYVVHDEKGAILSTISGPGKEYGKDVLDKQGDLWLFDPELQNLDPTTNFVDLTAAPKKIVPKQPIVLSQDKETIIADGSDESVISGIPEGAYVTVTLNGKTPQFSGVVTDGQIEISSDVPANYLITVTAQNMLAATLAVVAK